MKVTLDNLKSMIADQVGSAIAEKFAEGRAKGIEASEAGRAPAANPASVSRSKSDVGRLLRYMAQARQWGESVEALAQRNDDAPIMKAISSGLLTAGGAVIQGGFSEEILDALRPMAVVRSTSVQTPPLINGSWTQPYEDTGPTATYVGENQNLATTESTFGQLELTAKKLMAHTPVSNDWLNDTSGRGDTFIRDSLVRAMAVREDLAFIRGDGTSATPKGLKAWADDQSATNVLSSGGATIPLVTTDLNKLILAVEENDVPIMGGFFLFAPRTKAFLMSSRDGNNNLVWAPEMSQGTLLGFPFRTSNQIPTNLGGGTESEVYFVETSTTVLADEEEVMVQVIPGGAYWDGSAVQAGASRDQTLVIARSRHDFGCLYRGKEVAYISNATWGA